MRSELSMTTLLGRTRRPYRAYAKASFLNGWLYRRLGTNLGAGARDQAPERVSPITRVAVHANEPTGSIRFNCRKRARPSWLLLRLGHSTLGADSWLSPSPTTTHRR